MDTTELSFAKLFGMKILTQLFTRDFRGSIGRLTMNVMTVEVDIKHHNRDVTDCSQVNKGGSLKRT